MLVRFRAHILLGLLAFACAQGWNRWNIAVMQRSPAVAAQVRDGRALMAVDDASYLQAVDHFLNERPDLDRFGERARPELRAPGYGLWYLVPRLFMAAGPAISAMVLAQCLLYALTVALLWETLMAYAVGPRWRWIICLLFAVMPTFHGFLFHTLTEGVTPSLSLMLLCCALLSHRRGTSGMLWLGLALWSLLMITRPALLWVGLSLLPSLWLHRRTGVQVFVFCAAACLPTGIWWLTNVVKARELVGLHPVYNADEPGINRPVHGAFWDLARSWGASGEAFHQVMEPAFRAAMVCDTSSAFVERFVQLAPERTLTVEQGSAIRSAFGQWQHFNCVQLAPAIASGMGTVPFTTPEEREISRILEQVTNAWRSSHSFHHHVRVPLRVLIGMVAHSNLNLFLFQHAYRGRPLMETLRWLSALLHAGLLVAVLLAALLRTPPPLRWCAVGACAYLLYLAYVQRGVEERYTLPVLFMGVACAAFSIARPNFAPATKTRP